jgi:methyl-accepting chemotaxis protein
MNEQGDMLRVATTVLNKEGARGVGTFIPRRMPDGNENPVLAAVYKGKRFVGRVQVVDSWQLTAYEPLLDSRGRVIGMFFVGVQPDKLPALRQTYDAIRFGPGGYVFIIGGKDSQRGRYLVSKEGKRDGENIWEARDPKGFLFIQDMVNRSMAAPDTVVFLEYPWQNKGEPEPRLKLSAAVYLPEWDWTIGLSSYRDEIDGPARAVREGMDRAIRVTGVIALLVLGIAGLLSTYFVGRALGPLRQVSDSLRALATGDYSRKVIVGRHDEIGLMAEDVNRALEVLAEADGRLAEQAAALESASAGLTSSAGTLDTTASSASRMTTEVAASVQTVATMVQAVSTATTELRAAIGEISSSALESGRVAEEAARSAQGAIDTVARLETASEEIGSVLKLIGQIAHQTNMLALNATIEAARAGEAGRGFGVVADEVKALSARTAEASADIGRRVAGIQVSAREAVEAIRGISTTIVGIRDRQAMVGAAVEEQTAGTQEIARVLGEASGSAAQAAATVGVLAGATQTVAQSAGSVREAAATLSGRAAELRSTRRK